MAIQVKKITVSSAELLAILTTPKLMLAAPASGYVNNIIAMTHFLDYNSATYVSANPLKYYTTTNTNGIIASDTNIFKSTSDAENIVYNAFANTGIMSTERALYLSCANNPTVGDSPLYVYIIYEVKLMDV